MKKKEGGNTLVLVVVCLSVVLALLALFVLNYGQLLGAHKQVQSAIDAAALTAAGDISRVVVDTPLGRVALADDVPAVAGTPPHGSNYASPQASDAHPIQGIHTLVGTLRLDAIIASNLGNQSIAFLIGQDIARAQEAAATLNATIAGACLGTGSAYDKYGNPITIFIKNDTAGTGDVQKSYNENSTVLTHNAQQAYVGPDPFIATGGSAIGTIQGQALYQDTQALQTNPTVTATPATSAQVDQAESAAIAAGESVAIAAGQKTSKSYTLSNVSYEVPTSYSSTYTVWQVQARDEAANNYATDTANATTNDPGSAYFADMSTAGGPSSEGIQSWCNNNQNSNSSWKTPQCPGLAGEWQLTCPMPLNFFPPGELSKLQTDTTSFHIDSELGTWTMTPGAYDNNNGDGIYQSQRIESSNGTTMGNGWSVSTSVIKFTQSRIVSTHS